MKALNFKEWLREQDVDIENFISKCKNSGPDYDIYQSSPPSWVSTAFEWGDATDMWANLSLAWRISCDEADEGGRDIVLGFSQFELIDNDNAVSDYNVGKSNYAKHKIQPREICTEYKLDPFRADLIKRTLRTKEEEGMTLKETKIQDLEKMQHIIDKMLDLYKTNTFPWE
jgi:hypothetical protein